MSRASAFLAALALSCVSSLVPAWANGIGESSPIGPNADLDALSARADQPGWRAGNFRLSPTAATAVAYDSNLYASANDDVGAALSISEARLHVANEPGKLDLQGDAFARARRFADETDQNTTEYGATVSAQNAVSSQDTVTGRILAQRRFESRVDIETPNTRDVSFYDETRGDLGYSHQFNRLSVSSNFSGRRLRFEEDNQSYRDRTSYRGELRGEYSLRGGLSLVQSVYYGGDDYRFPGPAAVSAHSVGTLTGAHLSVPEVADVEITAGYFRRRFEQNLGEISGVSIRSTLTLYPTRLTTVRAQLIRQDEPTRVIGAYGKVRTTGLLEITHTYSRAVDLFVRGRYLVDDFNTIQRTDHTVLAETGVAWRISRVLGLALEYDRASRSSVVNAERFGRNLIGVSLTGHF